MRVLKTRWFARWARREGIADAILRAAVDEMRNGLVDANLGGGLVKKRVARGGAGKSEHENIGGRHLFDLRRLAQAYLSMNETRVRRLVDAGELAEVSDGESKTS